MRGNYKITFFTSTLEGGVGRIIINLLEGLKEKSFKIDLICVNAGTQFFNLIPQNVNLINLRLKRTLLSYPFLISYLLKQKPKILLSFTTANLVSLLAKIVPGIKTSVIISEHLSLEGSLPQINFFKRQVVKKLMQLLYPKANYIIAISKKVADDLKKIVKVPESKIVIIFNPVISSKIFQLAEKEPDEKINSILKNNIPFILSVGRLAKQKDYPTLIKAFSIVKKNFDLKLLILGEGEERPTLEKLIVTLNLKSDVFLPGFISNPYPVFKRAKLFVLSSAWEGLPTALIEAMAFGVPVVSTDCLGGSREILENGKYGKLVKVGDVEELAKAIMETIKNSPNSNLLKSRALDFSVEKSVGEYEKLFRKLV